MFAPMGCGKRKGMEENSGSVKQATERERADSAWVLRPGGPSGTSIELAAFTKESRPTPETLELLHRLMVRVQEDEAAAEAMEREACGSLTHCSSYTSGSCPDLVECGTFHAPK
ncbi:hypothetical protein AB0M35_05755 [Micromonospora sp. NPDC051196]|uniref:hypothetical protein n=1 Tax=Micromonospora sp. NPDC051196 TaxID=3155281 RepID=UPI00342256AA